MIFGASDNPSFQPTQDAGLMRVQYHTRSARSDSTRTQAGSLRWTASRGAVFVQRFVFEPQKEYPDGSSVEFWLNGVGTIHAYNKDMVMAANVAENPYVFESEVLSPFAGWSRAKATRWHYDWFATHIGGDYPVVGCNSVGVIAQPLWAKASLAGCCSAGVSASSLRERYMPSSMMRRANRLSRTVSHCRHTRISAGDRHRGTIAPGHCVSPPGAR